MLTSGSESGREAKRLPAAFLGHGSPANALDHNRYTEAWRAFGSSTGRPRAVLVVSAHWFVNATLLTAMDRPKTIHDFYGFPEELYRVEYPAPGDPDLASEVAELVKPAWAGLDRDGWGLDHGTWSLLVHAYPKADVPVVQLSVHAAKPLSCHFELGTKLATLSETGVVVIASGNVVHNLRAVAWHMEERAFDWALDFDGAVSDVMTNRPEDVASLEELPGYQKAAPTPDHFWPLAYLAGMAAARGEKPEVLVEGCTMGSLSMTSYVLPGSPLPAPDRQAG